MKSILFALTLTLLPCAAFAMPKVGDSATLEGTIESQGDDAQSADFSMTMTLDSYDDATKTYQETTVTTVKGEQPETKTETVKADQLPTDAMVDDMLTNCAAAGGKPEKLTIPAGTFDTCKLNTERGGSVNITAVPFGVAMTDSVTEDGFTIHAALTKFARGQ